MGSSSNINTNESINNDKGSLGETDNGNNKTEKRDV